MLPRKDWWRGKENQGGGEELAWENVQEWRTPLLLNDRKGNLPGGYCFVGVVGETERAGESCQKGSVM